MCGIFGWLSFNPAQKINNDIGEGLTDLLIHRGPEAKGSFATEQVFLGHRRLKIIDLSDDANQPMHDSSKRFSIIFNGEIYNYIELAKELRDKGVTLLTSSDTEVLLQGYLVWGKDVLEKIEGMFAFAIYDASEHSIFIARDHLGQKPLYYTFQNDQFVFASELRSIIKHPSLRLKIDSENLMKYHLYDVFPFTTTPIQNVHKLLPGHFLECSSSGLKVKQYWDSLPQTTANPMTLEDSLCELDSLLTSSLAKHLRADVPYGVFLSGGIDSSLIAAYAKKVLGEKELNTFTVKVGFADLDESEVARSVANWAGVKNKSFLLTESEVLSSIDDVLTHIDEPLADPGLINCSFICHQAKKHITVALAGDGGDELFGGYLSFKAISWHQQLSYLPDNLVRSLVWLMGRFLYANTGYMSKGFKLKQFIKGHFTTDAQRLPRWLSSFDLLELKNLYTKDISTKNNPENLFLEAIACAEKLNQKALGNIMLYQYQKYFLPEFVLGHTDRASMQTALEVRCPLIDKNLIEFANRLPFEFKVKNGQLKVELFKLLEQLNAPQVLLNHPKKGFTFPVADWMKGRLRPMLRDILSPQAVADIGLFNPTYVEKLISDHEAGRANNYRQLWNLLVLFCWKKNYPNVSFNG